MTSPQGADRFGVDLEGFRAALADRYTIERELGRGGHSLVFLAQDLQNHRPVAIKILRPELALHVATERFLREIEITAQLQHLHILPLFSSGSAAGHAFYVMPYIEGESLDAYLDRKGPLPVDEALRLVGEVAEALQYAHDKGVVHRDIKPGNVLLSGGHALVADFGVARALRVAGDTTITSEGTVIGTAPYMSPEQAGADTTDARSDQYALACVLYEMLAGQPPFIGPSLQAIIARHLAESPPPLRVVRPAVSPALQAVIERALAKVPADRWATVAEFAAKLKSSTSGRAPGSRRLTAGAALALLAAIAVAAWRFIIAPPAPLNPNAVVVFPLVESPAAADQEGAGLQAAVAIGNALEHTEPLQWIEGWTWLEPHERRDPTQLTARRARRIARERRARWYIEGTMTRHSDDVTVVLRLIDVATDSLAGRANDIGHFTQVPQAGWRALNKLLPSLLAPDREVDLSVLTDRDPGAVAMWLQGEREYRQSRFGAALDLYSRAVAADSALAIAALKGAWAARWEHRSADALKLVGVATAQATFLPAKYAVAARGLAYYMAGAADSALASFQHALRLDPDWVETWMAIGEVYYHFLTGVGDSDSAAQSFFEQALQLDPGFTPALLHLSQIALHYGDLVRARRLLDAFDRQNVASARSERMRMRLRCAAEGPGGIDWPALAARDPTALVMDGKMLAERAAHLPCAERAWRAAFETSDATLGDRWGATLGLLGVLIAQRRADEVRPLVDRAVALNVPQAQALYVVAAGLAPGMDEPAAAIMATLSGDLKTMGPYRLWYHALWSSYRGDTARLRQVAQALRALAPTRSEATVLADAAAGRLAALTGDTVEALNRLRRVTPQASAAELEWGDWDSFAAERLLYAELLLGRREWTEAQRVAGGLDHAGPVMHLAYVRRSLEVRVQAAEALGQAGRAADYRRRLSALDRPTRAT